MEVSPLDQAATLREIKKMEQKANKANGSRCGNGPGVGQRKADNIRVIAITSGKGVVGKTNIAANLAYILSTMQKKTLVLDADMGLANLDVILGLAPKFNLYHVLRGEKSISEVVLHGPGGIKILPASSGIQEMADLSKGQKLALIDELDGLSEELDFMFIDTAAGIAGNVIYFNMAAKEIIVVVSPEPTSITDAYALIKILYNGYREKRFMLLANMVKDAYEAKEVYNKLSNATSHFLNLSIDYLGYILNDVSVQEAVRQQKAVAELYPHSQAGKCMVTVAKNLCRMRPEHYETGSLKFFWNSVIDKDRG
jgi:flagellar biosynthesis protein FlhG